MENEKVDWIAWHSQYSDTESSLSRRLEIIQTHIRSRLLAQQESPVQAMSLCAGQGHDLLNVLEHLPGKKNIKALLIENDPRNVEVVSERLRHLDLVDVEVLCADAGNSNSYISATPADLLLLCGVFGNISDHDIFQTIEFLPRLCASGATVIWTRSRRHPDITPKIRQALKANGFHEKAFIAPSSEIFTVGVSVFNGKPLPLAIEQQLFRFV